MFLVDMPFKILPEVFQGALQGFHGTGGKRTEGVAGAQELGVKVE
jgi:hypothetical protein